VTHLKCCCIKYITGDGLFHNYNHLIKQLNFHVQVDFLELVGFCFSPPSYIS
jgi:hypothetical protein